MQNEDDGSLFPKKREDILNLAVEERGGGEATSYYRKLILSCFFAKFNNSLFPENTYNPYTVFYSKSLKYPL